ncbi:PREDICTED: RING-H2 finger protein ATL1-like [Ipomoea nil]|uniref:RING-H2 finger protein ATL1-like n=1 Tax=Ipomoea nil TaxID=35883 RepID=UPI000900D4D5|nr:PREDICTED: RING-H2 finger protein ATL1-like [Ipomoea nil]
MRMRNASHAFIFIILIAICTYIFKKMLRMFPQSAILNYVVWAAAQLKWGWDCLFIQSFCQPPPYKFNVVDGTGMWPEHDASELGARVFEGESEAVECAVCLCKIEEGEEVRYLRCNHIFHRDCLDRWLATGRNSCPLCRTQVKSAGRRLFDDRYQEVIVFDFFSGRQDRCTWLR